MYYSWKPLKCSKKDISLFNSNHKQFGPFNRDLEHGGAANSRTNGEVYLEMTLSIFSNMSKNKLPIFITLSGLKVISTIKKL